MKKLRLILKNTKIITYNDIKNLLISNNIFPVSSLRDDDQFTSFSSLSKANVNELTFFNDTTQLKKLEKTKAKACLINKKYLDLMPNSTKSILVDNTYNSFAILSNLFTFKNKSNGIISKNSVINNNSTLKDLSWVCSYFI